MARGVRGRFGAGAGQIILLHNDRSHFADYLNEGLAFHSSSQSPSPWDGHVHGRMTLRRPWILTGLGAGISVEIFERLKGKDDLQRARGELTSFGCCLR